MEAVLEKETKATATKAEVSLNNLQKALRIITPAVPPANCAIVGLRSIRIEQISDGLAVQATDLDASMRVLIPETTRLSEVLMLPSDRLLPWVKMLDGESVKLSTQQARVGVQCGKAKVSVPRISFEHPTVSYSSDSESFAMLQVDLLRLLKHTIIAIGDEERFALNGILFEADGEKLYAVAMDGHRMAIYSRPTTKTFRYLIPERMLRLMLPVIVEGKESVQIQETPAGFLASIAADIPVFIACRRPNGSFPKWQMAVPKDFVAEIDVESQVLLNSLGRCLLMGDQKSHAIALLFSADGIALHAVDAQSGEAEEFVDASGGPGKTVRIGVNGVYLSQALKQIGGKVKIMLPSDPKNPVLFRSEPVDGERFDYIVMPMQLKR